jgi:hypothetical protein
MFNIDRFKKMSQTLVQEFQLKKTEEKRASTVTQTFVRFKMFACYDKSRSRIKNCYPMPSKNDADYQPLDVKSLTF